MTDPIKPASAPPPATKRSWFRRHPVLTTILAIPVLLFASCEFAFRDQWVRWEEEVLLNTGETIIVKRSVPWKLQGSTGNPFVLGVYPSRDRAVLEFKYKDKSYRYAEGAHIGWIAISPTGVPNLVADPQALSWNWYKRAGYYCTVPYYVQFFLKPDNQTWTWPNTLEPWLYELPSNLLAMTPDLGEQKKSRYTTADKRKLDSTLQNLADNAHFLRIVSTHRPESCPTDDRNEVRKNPASKLTTSTQTISTSQP